MPNSSSSLEQDPQGTDDIEREIMEAYVTLKKYGELRNERTDISSWEREEQNGMKESVNHSQVSVAELRHHGIHFPD